MSPRVDLRQEMNLAYQPLLYNKSRWLVLMGGGGSGKSFFAAQKILLRCMQTKGHRILVVRKVARICRQSTYALLRSIIEQWGLSHLWDVRDTDLTLTYLPNGSTILHAGMDDPEKIKSIAAITSVWVEEATDLLPIDLTQLDLRLRGACPDYFQIILSFNPISVRHHLKARFFDKRHPNATVLTTTWRDNRFLDAQYFNTTLENLTGNEATVYREGQWGERKGLVYPPFEQGVCPGRPDETIYGLDFGFSHETALVKAEIVDGRPYVSELIYEPGLTSADLARKMREFKVSPMDTIYCDSARPEMIEDLYREGWNARPADKGQGSVLDGIAAVIKLAPVIDPAAESLLAELDSYRWKVDKDDRPLDQPVKEGDDAVDAMRYALASHEPLHTGARPAVIKPVKGQRPMDLRQMMRF